MGVLAPVPLLVALLSGGTATDQTQIGDYAFALDGRPFWPPIQHLNGSPGHPAPGDAIMVGDMWLTLGPELSLRFRTAPDRKGVLLETVDGARWVGIRIERDYTKHGDLRDPLLELSPEQVRGLWGLSAEEWSPSCAEKARWLDADRVYLAVGQSAHTTGLALPALPVGLRYLEAGKFRNWASLARLPWLEVLSLIPEEPVDVRSLGHLTHVRSLVFYRDVSHLEALSHLKALERLDLRYQRSARGIGFASELAALQEVSVSGTAVEDLRPLSRLRHLRRILASASAVRLLPEGPMPGLEEVELIGAAVPEPDVQRFRASHPTVRVRSRWNDALQETIAEATAVRITPGEGCALEGTSVQPVDVTDSSDVARAAALVRVVERNDQFAVCGCLGGPEIEFWRAEEQLASVSLACGDRARWTGWPAHAPLIDALALREWFANHGFTGPRDEAREQLERAAAYDRLTQRAVYGMSDALRSAFLKDLERAGRNPGNEDYATFATRLKDLPRVSDRIAVLFRVLGADNGSWSVDGAQVQVADALLRRYPRTELAAAVMDALLGADRQRRRGAARFWSSWHSPLEGWQPARRDDARRILLDTMQESPTDSVREKAVYRLQEWWADTPDADRCRRLDASLHDRAADVRRSAMLVAGQVGDASAEDVLLRYLRREAVELRALPGLPADELDEAESATEGSRDGDTDAGIAALALGYLRSERARPLLEAATGLEPFTMPRVALALYGECERLSAEDFDTPDRNQARQLAAVEAVVRCRGRSHLVEALKYEQATHGWEPEFVAQRLRDALLATAAPGSDQLRPATSLADLRAWYARHGEEFVAAKEARP